MDAIDRGIHVLTENPLCVNMGEFKHLKAAYIKATKNTNIYRAITANENDNIRDYIQFRFF